MAIYGGFGGGTCGAAIRLLEPVGLPLLLSPLGSNIVIRTACCTVGIALPVYSTFKAIEKKDQNEQEKWLLYWAAYGSFSLVEIFSDKLLSWFPFYYHTKLAFLVWLQLPSGNGSKHLYSRHLRPFLLKHQARIDRLLNLLSNEINKFISNHRGEIHFVKAAAIKCATTANQMVNDIVQMALPGGMRNTIEDQNSRLRQEADDSDGETGN
uniref:HVA22-like protein n=1 Tax=Ananas comosus var. bracteatus TaxID=296719 RepID=A0A6V7NJC7_ANACO|nr:unnamed protein product [Ananas comosus var. bracteatus]